LAGPFSLQILSIIGEGDQVAVEVFGRGVRAATGREYLQHYSYHFHLSHGLISEIGLYQDTFHYWDVWENPGSPARSRSARSPLSTDSHRSPVDELSGGKEPVLERGSGLDRVAANKQAVRRFLVAFVTKDPDTVRAVWAPEAVWSFAVGGSYSPQAHAFQGAPRWERDAMIDMQQTGQRGLQEPLTLDLYSLIGEGDEVCAEAVGILVRANGRAYRQHYSIHFQARAGRLIEGHVYQDTLHQYDLGLDHDPYAPVAVPLSVQ
jgi:ketosteroid isomerase-like protein